MRITRLLLTALCAAFFAASAPAFAAPNVPGADSSSTLGPVPLFNTGFATDQYGNWYKQIVDSTATTPAVAGNLVAFGGSSANWLLNATANASYAAGQYGIVYTAAAAQGGAAVVQVRGNASALCTTTSVAIAKGSLLVADGAGNLTVPAPVATPSSGSATPQGTTGSTTVSYKLYARNQYNLDSATSATITTTSANATLSPANSVLVTATVPTGTTSVIVVRSAGGAAQGVIGQYPVPPGQTNFNFLDIGYVAGAATYTPNATPVYPAGTVLAVAQGALTTSSSATAVSVFLGAF